MDYIDDEYVELEFPAGYGRGLSNRMRPEMFPDIFVGENPIQMDEVYYALSGNGHRISYSYRPTITMRFKAEKIQQPLINKFHRHDYFELVFIASDSLEMRIEPKLYDFRKGDLCILNRTVRHAECFKPEVTVFYLLFSPEYLGQFLQEKTAGTHGFASLAKIFNMWLNDGFPQGKDFINFRYSGQAVSPLFAILEAIKREFKEKLPGYQFFIHGLVYRLFFFLSGGADYEIQHINLGFDDGFSLAYATKQILDKDKQKLTKLQLEQRLGYNGEYINRVFKRHYGYTIAEYCRLMYLRQAAYLLRTTNRPANEICDKLGLVNRTHFYALFVREYGCTPAEYRKKGHGSA